MSEETARLAINLARNCGWRVFPCGEDKRPTLKRWPDLASNDPAEVAGLWQRHPGPLIGVATGKASGVDVLDLDVKHEAASAWFHARWDRIPPTRAFRTRSGGLHLYFIHAEGVRNTQGRLSLGVDTRGDGGYAIFWCAAGHECIDHELPAPWPAWLLTELLARPESPEQAEAPRAGAAVQRRATPAAAGIAGILKTVVGAPEGQRNGLLNWGAFAMREHVAAGEISRGEAEARLVAAAVAAGLTRAEAIATARSGLRGAS